MANASDSATIADQPRKSLDHAKKELRSILGKMDDLRLTTKAWRLLRVRSRLKQTRTQLRARHLWILLIATWISLQLAWNHAQTYRYSKVSNFPVSFFLSLLIADPKLRRLSSVANFADRI